MEVKWLTDKQWRRFHKIILSITFIQLLLWGISGLYMVLMDIDYIRGTPFKAAKSELTPEAVTVSVKDIYLRFPKTSNLRLSSLANTPVYHVSTCVNSCVSNYISNGASDNERTYLINASSGELINGIDEALAREIAATGYQSDGPKPEILSATLFVESAPSDFPARLLPAWQIQFGDNANTRFYIDASTGDIRSVRHQYWRLFDLMWQLHIMDYDDGADVDNPMLTLFILSTLAALLSGVMLLFGHIQRSRRKHRRKEHGDPEQSNHVSLTVAEQGKGRN
ncbi:hypothetical protein [Thalassotalea sp. PS06]|uniref:hypothetical protein n=1 Tax=Thalassotalea sp. PS06 TaxID=2594005 RepID=UPI0011650923|nr:hypothetical protein [Thalassotalea sp. PS06]QDP00580.1 hypothetical protein FNC98_03955 [Thalassotalea sp. PS06]